MIAHAKLAIGERFESGFDSLKFSVLASFSDARRGGFAD